VIVPPLLGEVRWGKIRENSIVLKGCGTQSAEFLQIQFHSPVRAVEPKLQDIANMNYFELQN